MLEVARSLYAYLSPRHFSSLPRLSKIPSKYRPRAIEQAQQAITEYLHATRALPYAYAENIGKNAIVCVRSLIAKLDYSARTFRKSVQRYLRYHPINEFEFLFESIGIDNCEVSGFLPPKKFFLSEDRRVLDAACALCGFGFPWNRLGELYRKDSSIFRQSSKEITSRLCQFKDYGFGTSAVIGICLAFPRVLREAGDLGGDDGALFDRLRRVFLDFDCENCIEETVDSWRGICRKVRVFYDLSFLDEETWELIASSKRLLLECTEDVLIQKAEYFCKFGVRKEKVGILLLRRPEILDFDLDSATISVGGILKPFGLGKEELKSVSQKYPYVFGRNKMANLPHVVRALNLQEWLFDRIRDGHHQTLANYALSNPREDLDKEYSKGLEEIQRSRTPSHTMSKLEFLHSVGFGQNGLTMKVLKHAHGTSTELQDRFYSLLGLGIEFSRLCRMLSDAPKILNQKPETLEQKLRFLSEEMGVSHDYLDIFPAFLCFDLEKRIKPRFRFQKWVTENGICTTAYSIASMVATSEKAFVARIYGIHPAVLKHWFERFSYGKGELGHRTVH